MSSNVVTLEAFTALPDHARLLGLDLGTKTIGLALSDVERQIATPLETIKRVKFTQDAAALQALVAALDDPQAAAAYGRQLPHPDATPVAAHARLFNYPDASHTRRWSDAAEFGIKTCFLSNSFAAYRVQALREVGGFPANVILGEDMHLAARLLQAGYAIRYQAQAKVYHSHNYSWLAEFRRYFDVSVPAGGRQ